MDLIVIILIIVLLFGGFGGYYGYQRGVYGYSAWRYRPHWVVAGIPIDPHAVRWS